MNGFRMNSPEGKAILAWVRDGDYAHPGEEEANARAAALLGRVGVRRTLDVGCGRGGTAAWFHRQGFGEVIGVDVDAASIAHAAAHYPKVRFLKANVAQLSDLGLPAFDLVYSLTAFYAFPNQEEALRQITAVCRPGGQLLLVDYTRPRPDAWPAGLGAEIGQPVVIDRLVSDLAVLNWERIEVRDWSPQFLAWYAALLDRFERRRDGIQQRWGDDWYRYVKNWYGALYRALASGELGGAAITAVKNGGGREPGSPAPDAGDPGAH